MNRPGERDEGFLARWSRRKALVREGVAPPPEPVPPAPPAAACPPTPTLPAARAGIDPAAPATGPCATADPPAPRAAEPPPTLAEAERLTPASDFSRFVAPEVEPQVRNAALKKLFADPHFNVMDGLDTYIDDYHTPDPLPPSMLKQMAQAAFLGLVAEEPRAVAADATADTPHCPIPDEPTAADEDADLRLQPNDPAGPAGPGPGPGGDAGRAR